VTTTAIPESKLVLDQVCGASAALPAAGAFSTGLKTEILVGATEAAIVSAYTRGGAGGSFKLRVWWYFQGDEDVPVGHVFRDDANATVADPIVTVAAYQLVLQGEAAADANPVRRALLLTPPPGAVAVRLDVAEVGAVGTPGTLALRVVSRRG
jgi:hypothetical protein